MYINKRKFIFSFVFTITFLSLFLLNNNRKDPSNLLLLNSILSFFTLLFICVIPSGFFNNLHLKVKVIDFFLFVIILSGFVFCLIVRGYIIVHWVYLFIFYILVSASDFNLSTFLKKSLLFIGFFSLVLQLVLFDLDGRPVLSYIDSNYSSMMIFLFSVYVFYNIGKFHSLLPFSLGILTLSRAYVLVCLVFFLLYYIRKYDLLNRTMLFFTRPIVSFVIITFLPLLINFVFVLNFTSETVAITTVDNKFSGSLIDRSNLDRSLASVLFITQLTSNPFDYMFGVNIDWYLDNVFRNSPHHSFFQMVLNYGWVFSLPYIFIFLLCSRRICLERPEMAPFYIALFIYLMTLGGGLFGMTLIFIGFIFRSSSSSSSRVTYKCVSRIGCSSVL